MSTAAKKKTVTKAPVVPAKAIANAAAKVQAQKAAVAPTPAKPLTKVLTKPLTKQSAKAASKVPAKAIAKTAAQPVPKKTGTGKVAKLVKALPTKNAAAVPASVGGAKDKIKKTKLVRDSFTMPEAEYAVLGDVKKACIAAGIEVKKSQLLRVGLVLLKKTDIASLKSLIEGLAPLKAGRPKTEK
jgi:cell wall-associated NlpC family hydrolase